MFTKSQKGRLHAHLKLYDGRNFKSKLLRWTTISNSKEETQISVISKTEWYVIRKLRDDFLAQWEPFKMKFGSTALHPFEGESLRDFNDVHFTRTEHKHAIAICQKDYDNDVDANKEVQRRTKNKT